jgi:hypothetical protein
MTGFEDNGGLAEADAWGNFETSLGVYLATMRADDDHLIVETPDGGDDGDGLTPYAQFCVAGAGRIRAEISSNAYLVDAFKLTDEEIEDLVEGLGWQLPDDPDAGQNLFLERSVDQAASLASVVTEVLEDVFGIPHPTLMSAHAWGPAAAGVEILGIPATSDVATDVVDTDAVPPFDAGVIVPKNRDHLVELVRRFLTEFLEDEPSQDDDGDFVIPHDGAPVYVRVRPDQPVVDVFTRVVHDVHGRRQAAVEVGVLNRDHLFSRFVLHNRVIYQVMNLPALPFVPAHLKMCLPGYLELIDQVRDDLALRTSGRAA